MRSQHGNLHCSRVRGTREETRRRNITMNFRLAVFRSSDSSAVRALLSRMDGITSRIYLIEHTESIYYSRSRFIKDDKSRKTSPFRALFRPKRGRRRKAGRNLFVAHTHAKWSRLVVRVSTNPPVVSLMVISFSRKSSIRCPVVRAADSYESARPVRVG